MPLSSAKAAAINAPLPVYPYQAKRHHITGDGVCVITVNTASGKVTNATMKQSTGNAILDKSTTEAFRQWRFKPRTVSRRVRVPITYTE
jgi:TonB family protein